VLLYRSSLVPRMLFLPPSPPPSFPLHNWVDLFTGHRSGVLCDLCKQVHSPTELFSLFLFCPFTPMSAHFPSLRSSAFLSFSPPPIIVAPSCRDSLFSKCTEDFSPATCARGRVMSWRGFFFSFCSQSLPFFPFPSFGRCSAAAFRPFGKPRRKSSLSDSLSFPSFPLSRAKLRYPC